MWYSPIIPSLSLLKFLFFVFLLSNSLENNAELSEVISITEANETNYMFIVDCDKYTVDMVVNAALCWGRLRGLASVESEMRILCMAEQCCRDLRLLGFQTLGLEDRFEIYRFTRMGYDMNGPAVGGYLDSIMLYRDLVMQQLVNEGVTVIRSDADVCFLEDPTTTFESYELDIYISAEEMHPSFRNWAYQWSCNPSHVDFHATINHGVALMRGKHEVAQHLASIMGRGLHVLSGGLEIETNQNYSPDGWAQQGGNIHFHALGLCFPMESNSSQNSDAPIWNGHTTYTQTNFTDILPSLKIGIFSVCTPCSEGRHCKDNGGVAPIIHCNCMERSAMPVYFAAKVKCLKDRGGWFLRENWRNLAQLILTRYEEENMQLDLSSFLRAVYIADDIGTI